MGLWESPWKKGYVGVVCGRSPQTTPTYGPYHGRSQRDCKFIEALSIASGCLDGNESVTAGQIGVHLHLGFWKSCLGERLHPVSL